ncbi:hypothetical protein GLOTRDRAFT_111910 [Gloeophyllum trabeum ATCC 11539]|uniref:Uncharacterized protein n=1 Tax=Gloeophyllum trabeum (strain ATCC 11539 / FP-39264 / Madison 617) TaxID=670483 RepID=S7RKP8_GLOTA|nr:uncharacterized protein GLOTRDRAFT_111910 [Gloeophyllum trabeum ATCC 11539]EPQ53244.1 hypothetical protein GLOTRDRAFT_111910 [Gloeophyllum trabeum ATCC 11539]
MRNLLRDVPPFTPFLNAQYIPELLHVYQPKPITGPRPANVGFHIPSSPRRPAD